jgi:putative transposase
MSSRNFERGKAIKRRCSRPLRDELRWLQSRLPTLWSSYFVSTVSGAPLAVIRRYIENQKNV